jgi:hypothetical protein
MEATNEDDFEKQWRDAFDDAELEPSPVVWAGIEDSLPSVKPKYNLWTSKVVISSLVLLFFSGYFAGMSIWKNYKTHSSNKTESKKPIITKNDIADSEVNNLQSTDNQRVKKENNSKFESKLQKSTQNKEALIGSINPKGNLPINSSKKIKAKSAASNNQKVDNQPFVMLKGNQTPPTFIQNEEIKKTSGVFFPDKEYNLAKADSSKNLSPRLQNTFVQAIDNQDIKWVVPKYETPLIVLENEGADRENTQNKRNNRLVLSLSFVPNLFKPNLSANYEAYINTYLQAHQVNNVMVQGFFNGLSEKDQKNLSYGLNLALSYRLNSRWGIRTGVQYVLDKVNKRTNAFFIDHQTGEINTFMGNMMANNISNLNFLKAIHNHPNYQRTGSNVMNLNNFNDERFINVQSNYHYLGIPLQIGYTFSPNHRFYITAWAGLGLDIFLTNNNSSKDVMSADNFSNKDFSALKTLNNYYLANLQINYKFNQNWSLFIEPSYRNSIRSYSKPNTMLDFKPRNLGFGWGVSYNF